MSEEQDSNLLSIYKSAVSAMEQEVLRLNRLMLVQRYNKKLESLKDKKNSLTDILSSRNSQLSSKYDTPRPSSRTRRKTSISSDDKSMITAKITETTQKINREKRKKMQIQDLLEDNLRLNNTNLYLIITKLLESNRTNKTLRAELQKLNDEKRMLLSTYSRVTSALVKASTQGESLEKIESLEKMNKEKAMSLNVLTHMIKELKEPKVCEDPKNKQLFQRITELEAILKENEKIKREIKLNIQMAVEDIENRRRNPEKITPAAANKYLRQETRALELEIAERSKVLKEVERELLVAQIKCADLQKKRDSGQDLQKIKSLSNSNTHSSLAIDRNSSRIMGGSDTSAKTRKGSLRIIKLLTKEKDNAITKDVLAELEPYAPGKNIATKIIAFNRSNFSVNKQ